MRTPSITEHGNRSIRSPIDGAIRLRLLRPTRCMNIGRAHDELSNLVLGTVVLTVHAEGAQVFGFGAADPPFTGHQLCSGDPWVQGPGDPAPLHPTATGELAIALAPPTTLGVPVNAATAKPASSERKTIWPRGSSLRGPSASVNNLAPGD